MATSVINADLIVLPSIDLSSINNLLNLVYEKNGSDLHIAVNHTPYVRIDGILNSVGTEPLSKDKANYLIRELMTEDQQMKLDTNLEEDFGFSYSDKARFRANVFFENGNICAAYRLIPKQIKTLE